jgi:nicotinamide mononucleotide (NMN) deamidase PncC
VAQARNLSLAVGLGGSYVASSSAASYNINSGYSYFGLLRVQQKFENFQVFADGQYENTNQTTTQANQTFQEYTTKLGVSWGF